MARMEMATGRVNAVSMVDCCTPDFFPDSEHIVFSRRPGEWTELWMANADGSGRRLLYAQPGRHVYGGCISPDGKYALFTGNKQEDGDPGHSGAPMGIIRLDSAPVIRGEAGALRKQYPNAVEEPVLELPAGWEPHWWEAPKER